MNLVKNEPETSAEYRAFKSLLGHVLTVPREEMQRREADYQKKAKLNPFRRGPKAKRKRGSDPAAQA
jgi:hypothetical protein